MVVLIIKLLFLIIELHAANCAYIDTLAGTTTTNFYVATASTFVMSINGSAGMCGNSRGEVFYVDTGYSVVRKINSGIYSPIAGSGFSGFSGDGGQATTSTLRFPTGVWIDSGSVTYIADKQNNRVRIVSGDGVINTAVGGGGTAAALVGPATAVVLSGPTAVWADSNGVLYVAEQLSNRVRKVSAGIISAFIGGASTATVVGSNGDGGPATSALLSAPQSVFVDSAGVVFVADSGNCRIRKVVPSTGKIAAHVGVSPGTCTNSASQAQATAISLNKPYAVWGDSSGNFYFSELAGHRVRVMAFSDTLVATFAGTGTSGFTDRNVATSCALNSPTGLWGDSVGNVFVADSANKRIRQVSLQAPTPTSQPSGQPSRQPSSQPSRQPTMQPTSLPTSPTAQPTSQPSIPTSQPSVSPSTQPSRQPTGQPSRQPSSQPTEKPNHPTSQPSGQPSRRPTSQPTRQPFSYPSGQPSRVPTSQPTRQPFMAPSSQPTKQPLNRPTSQPTSLPSSNPTQPTSCPSNQPTGQPSRAPSTQPTVQPTSQPSKQPCLPSSLPSSQPTNPTSQPSGSPSSQPSRQPTGQPSRAPSAQPSGQPSRQPSSQPSRQPSSQPSGQPSRQPSAQPSRQPFMQPTGQPSRQPSSQPTRQPVGVPSSQPSAQPNMRPSAHPSSQPSSQPSRQPFSRPSSHPSCAPSSQPTKQPFSRPSSQPSLQPFSHPSSAPTAQPVSAPTSQPFSSPTSQPTAQPVLHPTNQPVSSPTSRPSGLPVAIPTSQPTGQPASRPSSEPTYQPSGVPTSQPSISPVSSPTSSPSTHPSSSPTSSPSGRPTNAPSKFHTGRPSSRPSSKPTSRPTGEPSSRPSGIPSSRPSSRPSSNPTSGPSAVPSSRPSSRPSSNPTSGPSAVPSSRPSSRPSSNPTSGPSSRPSSRPTSRPTSEPSSRPSVSPSTKPTLRPTASPTSRPSVRPTAQPTSSPTSVPSGSPTGAPSKRPTKPSMAPTEDPTIAPSQPPSICPSVIPSAWPSLLPSMLPTTDPSLSPSTTPTASPSATPSLVPSTTSPSTSPSAPPTALPSLEPTVKLTVTPSGTPSGKPAVMSSQPSEIPSLEPSVSRTNAPSQAPSAAPSPPPSTGPSRSPSASKPTRLPSTAPTPAPTVYSSIRTAGPSAQPTSSPTISHKTLWTRALQNALSDQASNSSIVAHKSTYFELDVAESSSSTVYGSCSGWLSTLSGDIAASLYAYKPVALKIDALESLDGAVKSVSCGEPAKVVSILTQLTNSRTALNSNVTCSGHSWVAKSCVGGGKALCVDCTNPCAPTAHCSGSSKHSSMVIAPCVSAACSAEGTGGAVSSAFRILTVSFLDLQTAPSVTASTIATTKTSITATLTLSAPGTAYCGVFPAGAKHVPSSVDEVVTQNFAATSQKATNTSVVTISGLKAVTSYWLYCLTASSVGVRMGVEAMVGGGKLVNTLCCKTVTVGLSTNVLQEGQSLSNLLSFSLTSQPSSSLQVTLSASLDGSTPASAVKAFFPAVFSVSSTQTTSAFQASLYALPPGVYTVIAQLSGGSAAEFEVVYLSKVFTVLDASLPPPAPVLSSAVFSNDGSFLTVKFDSSTDKAGLPTSFACAKLFSFKCAAAAKCLWTDSSTVQASILVSGAQVCAEPQGTLALNKQAAVKAQCLPSSRLCASQSGWQNASSSTVLTIDSPLSAVYPSVVISAPTVIGACDSFTIDITSSTGSGGRAWQNFSIAVQGVEGNSSAKIQRFMDTSYRVTPPVAVPAHYFVLGATYNFVVTLCNFLDRCSQGSAKVVVLDNRLPSVTLPGQTVRSISRSSALVISSAASLSSCSSTGGSGSSLGLTYKWSITANGVQALNIVSASKDPSKLLLEPFSLSTGSVYVMTLTVTTAEFQSASAAVTVLVGSGAVKAVVAGGASRSVRGGEVLTIDASRSYDEDVRTRSASAAGLTFVWSCSQTGPVYDDSCVNVLIMDGADGDSGLLSVNVLALSSSAGSQNGFPQVEIVVTVLDSALVRSSQAVVSVTVLPQIAAVVGLTSNLASGVMNAGQVLQLTGTINLPVSVSGNATWSVDDSSFRIPSATQSAITNYLPPSGSNATRSVYMAFAMNSLPVGTTFTFSLSCLLPKTNTLTVAKVTISVNSPPQPGSFSVSPDTGGVALTTSFSFVASQWVDSNLPLSYQFGYISTAGTLVVLRSRAEVTFGTAYLSAGLESQGHLVSCVAQVFDSLSANTSVTYHVKVEPGVVLNSTQVAAYVSASLLQGSASADGIKQSTALSSYLLNVVDCKGAPNCSALNREQCYRTVNTCGACIGDTIGESGDSNSACFSALSRPAQGSTDLCSASADCSNIFAVCVGGRCVVPNKRCVADCSGHGRCVFEKATSNEVNKTLSLCTRQDTTCRAVCRCDADYSMSSACDVGNAEMAAKQQSRLTIISSISALTALEDPSEQVVEGWMSSLGVATQNTDELSAAASNSVLAIAATILNAASSIGLSPQSSGVLLSTLNSVTTAVSNHIKQNTQRRLSSSGDGSAESALQIQTLLQQYSAHVASTVLPGLPAVSASFDQFKMSTQFVSAGLSVSLPLTSLEALNGLATSSLFLPDNAEATAVSVMSIQSQLYGGDGDSSSFNSNPLSLLLSSLPCASPPCEIRIVLQNSQPVPIGSLNTWNEFERINTTCHAGVAMEHNYTCADGFAMTNITCDGSRNYVIHSRCPVTVFSPVCNSLVGAAATESSACRVLDSSDFNITCGCLLGAVSNGGRRLATQDAGAAPADDGSYSVSYVAMLSATTKTFVNTFSSAGGLNAGVAKDSWEVIVTMGVFAAAIIAALLVSHQADLKESKEKLSSETKDKLKKQPAVRGSKVSPTKRDLHSHKKRKNRVSTSQIVSAELALVEQSLPKVLNSALTFSQRFSQEVKQHHRWLGVVFFFSESFPRALRVASLATNVIIMLFIQSITYNLTNPDDGTCETFNSPVSCAEPRSSYATGESKCEWSANSSAQGGSCSYLQPDGNMKIVLFVAIFSAIVSTPIALAADWVLQKIIAAPITPVKRNAVASGTDAATGLTSSTGSANVRSAIRAAERTKEVASGRAQRRSVFQSVQAVLGGGRSKSGTVANYQMQLTKLSNEIRRYREDLSAQQRIEFDLLWGLDAEGNFLSGTDSSPSLWARLFGAKTEGAQQGRNKKNMNVHQAVLEDLRRVDEVVLHELERYPAQSGESATRAVATKERSKLSKTIGKRLLFLFQCDLLPGISGKILHSKSARDNASVKTVSRATHSMACVALTLLNAGMLFYIFLFAMQQSEHRQSAWFQSFMVWLVVEILIVSTAIVFLMHVVIPSLIMKDVTKIKHRLLDNIREFHSRIANKDANGFDGAATTEELPFNAARYLFVSTRLAEHHSALKEAQIIAQFSTPWPKQSYQHVIDVSKTYSKKFTAVSRSASIIVLFFVTNLLQVPPTLQDMIIHMVTTTTIGYTALLHIQLFGIFPLLAFGPFIALCVITHFVIQSGKAKARNRLAMLMPAAASASKDNALETGAKGGLDKISSVVLAEADPSHKSSHKTRRQSLQQGLTLVGKLNRSTAPSSQNLHLVAEEVSEVEAEGDDEHCASEVESVRSSEIDRYDLSDLEFSDDEDDEDGDFFLGLHDFSLSSSSAANSAYDAGEKASHSYPLVASEMKGMREVAERVLAVEEAKADEWSTFNSSRLRRNPSDNSLEYRESGSIAPGPEGRGFLKGSIDAIGVALEAVGSPRAALSSKSQASQQKFDPDSRVTASRVVSNSSHSSNSNISAISSVSGFSSQAPSSGESCIDLKARKFGENKQEKR